MSKYLEGFKFCNTTNLLFSHISLEDKMSDKTTIEKVQISGNEIIKKYKSEFWTAKQRQANSIHELSYRACFKPQLPKFFIERFTKEKDYVYDPFL